MLIIDDLGMLRAASPLAEELLEIIMRRYERASTPADLKPSGGRLGNAAAISTMLHRLLHHGRVVKCGPRSWRTNLDAPEP